jgi:hypothetical protein
MAEVRLTAHTKEIARWRSCAGPVPAKLAVSGDLVAADADSSGRLDVADVIYCRGRPPDWLGWTLERFPGCAVAATGSDRDCLVACRAIPPIRFSFFNTNELWSNTLICAMFVHGWRIAGWPLSALDPHGLVVTAEHVDSVRAVAGNSAMPIPFALYYESRCRISPASGAPISE